jgi:hypothetical protein
MERITKIKDMLLRVNYGYKLSLQQLFQTIKLRSLTNKILSGHFFWVILGLFFFNILAWFFYQHQLIKYQELQVMTAELQKTHKKGVLQIEELNSKIDSKIDDDLIAFEAYLLPSEEIPNTVKELLELSEALQLKVLKGEYRIQEDISGGFMRYRISYPIRGKASIVHRYIEMALFKHKTLALESVQFKRDQIETIEIEARMHWVIFTRLPLQESITTISKGVKAEEVL